MLYLVVSSFVQVGTSCWCTAPARPTTAWDNLIKDWLNWIWRHTMSQLLQSIFTPGRRAEPAGKREVSKSSPQQWWWRGKERKEKSNNLREKTVSSWERERKGAMLSSKRMQGQGGVDVCPHIWSLWRVGHWSVMGACSLINCSRPQLTNQPNQTATPN